MTFFAVVEICPILHINFAQDLLAIRRDNDVQAFFYSLRFALSVQRDTLDIRLILLHYKCPILAANLHVPDTVDYLRLGAIWTPNIPAQTTLSDIEMQLVQIIIMYF